MQPGPTILPSSTPDVKLLYALLSLFALKGAVKGAAIGALLVLVLGVYLLVASALVEFTSNIAALWSSGDSITKLFLLCLAIYIVHRLFPCIVYLHKRGII